MGNIRSAFATSTQNSANRRRTSNEDTMKQALANSLNESEEKTLDNIVDSFLAPHEENRVTDIEHVKELTTNKTFVELSQRCLNDKDCKLYASYNKMWIALSTILHRTGQEQKKLYYYLPRYGAKSAPQPQVTDNKNLQELKEYFEYYGEKSIPQITDEKDLPRLGKYYKPHREIMIKCMKEPYCSLQVVNNKSPTTLNMALAVPGQIPRVLMYDLPNSNPKAK